MKKNILIYGAGEAGKQSLKILSKFNIVSFIDDKKNRIGRKINRIPILSSINLDLLIKKKKIKEIFVCIPSLNLNQRRHIINKLNKYNIKIKILPDVKDIISGKVSFTDFNPVQINELINRKVNINLDQISENIYDKNILITGAGGSIGSELSRQIIVFNPKKIFLIDNSEYNLYTIDKELTEICRELKIQNKFQIILCNILDLKSLKSIFIKNKIDIVFHTAAFKHVSIIEKNIIESVKNNIFGSINIVNLAIKFKCLNCVFISSDKAVNPTNILGATKRFVEIYFQSLSKVKLIKSNTKLSVVRFGNVMGSSGSVIPLFNKQISDGGPVTVTDKQVERYFMTIPEAVSLILQSVLLVKGGEIFVLNMGKQVKIYNLAKKMISLSGLKYKKKYSREGDIEIQIIGLKDGEKLKEELTLGKQLFKTKHKDILLTDQSNRNLIFMNKKITLLKECVKKNNENLIIKIFNNVIEGFNR